VSPSRFRERGAQAASACHGGPPTELAARCGLHVRDGRIDPGALTLTTGGISMDVTIETLPAAAFATVRHSARTRRLPRRSTARRDRRRARSLRPRRRADARALPRRPETTPPAELRSDAALVVRDGVELPSGLSEVTLPAGRYAKASHRGAYSAGDAWARLMGEWLPRSGFRVGPGLVRGLRHRSRTTADRGLVTDLYVPLTAT